MISKSQILNNGIIAGIKGMNILGESSRTHIIYLPIPIMYYDNITRY